MFWNLNKYNLPFYATNHKHLRFSWAYFIASTSIVSLVTFYAQGTFRSIKLLPFYQTMYFFKGRKQRENHPEIGPAYMLACPCSQFAKVCNELLKVSEGHFALKVKWAVRYWWYKRVAR